MAQQSLGQFILEHAGNWWEEGKPRTTLGDAIDHIIGALGYDVTRTITITNTYRDRKVLSLRFDKHSGKLIWKVESK